MSDKNEYQIKQMKEHQTRVVHSTVMATGYALILLGVVGLISPDIYVALISIEPADVRLYCAIICLVGMTDIVIANKFFGPRTRL